MDTLSMYDDLLSRSLAAGSAPTSLISTVPLAAYTAMADDTTTTLDTAPLVSAIGTSTLAGPTFIGGSFNPIVTMAATSTSAAPAAAKSSAAVLPTAAPTTTGVVTPDMQPGQPGSPGHPFNYTQPTGTWDGTSLNQTGWLGGDRLTGKYGDPGALGGGGASYSINSANSVLGPIPAAESWVGSAKSQVAAGDYKDAAQQVYNNMTWDEDNLNFPVASTGTTTGQDVSDLDSATTVAYGWSANACVGEAIGVAAATAAAIATPNIGTIGTAVSNAVVGASACQQYIPSIINGAGSLLNTPDPSYYPLASADEDIFGMLSDDASFAMRGLVVVGFDTTPNKAPAGMSTAQLLSSTHVSMTPGFAPSQAFLNEVKPALTAAALHKYFPHG